MGKVANPCPIAKGTMCYMHGRRVKHVSERALQWGPVTISSPIGENNVEVNITDR